MHNKKNDNANEPLERQLKYEALFMCAIIAGLCVIFKIAFAATPSLLLLRTVLALCWMFLIPGYALMLAWRGQLSFIERIAIGIGAQAVIMSVLSYYFVLLGWHLQMHGLILPIITIVVGIVLYSRRI